MRKTSSFLTRALALTMVGAMSISICPFKASATETDNQGDSGEASYVYGTVDLPYADYYYGELNTVEESATLDLQATDKAAELRADGYLDAISSATTAKWKMYTTTYYAEHENGDGGGYIYGIGDCSIAVPTSLYNAAKEYVEDEIDDTTQCNNPLLSIIASMKVNADQTAPTEYKVLNGDGTLTEMKDAVDAIEKTPEKVIIENRTTYGHYEFDITDSALPTRDTMEGAIFETQNGKKYALLHSDNLWFQTGHIAFAVEDGFVVHSANTLKYKQFEDLQGETITKVRYIVRGGADVVYTTSLYCKKLLTGDQGISGGNAVYADGAAIQMTKNVPSGTDYQLASVVYGSEELTEGTDYTYNNDTLTIKQTDNTGIGTYTLTYSDTEYENIIVNVQFTSSMTESQIKIEDNKVVISDDAEVDIAAYVNAIDSIKVNGTALRGTEGVINSDGSVNFDAVINFHGNKTVVFPDADTEYEIAITASGYPAVSGTVKSPALDTSVLQSVIAQAKALKETDYTAATWANVQEKLSAAESELNAPSTQTAIDEAASDLKTAIEALQEETPKTEAPTTQAPTTQAPTTQASTTKTAATTVKTGETYTNNNVTYKVTAVGTGKGTVQVTATKNKKITSVTIPATVTINNESYKVTSIAKSAFANCKKLKKVVIGSNVKTIGASAFSGCTKLTTVTIGKNVTTIGNKAFYKCTTLAKITIPSKVSSIGKQTFYGDKKLKSITIKTTKLTSKKVGSKAFKGIYSKATIKVPKSKLSSYKKILKAKGVGSKAKIKK